MIQSVLGVIAPVFLVIAAGYISVKVGYFKDVLVDSLSRFALGFAIPVLLFRAVYQMDLGASFDSGLLISFYLGALASFAAGCIIARRIFHNRPGESVVIGFGALFSNSVLLGLAITRQAYGEDALTNNFVIVSVHAPFCYLVGIFTMEWVRADGRSLADTTRVVTKSLLSNALMIGLGLGFIFNLLNIDIPTWGRATIDMIAQSALPVALFGLGGVLTRYRIQDRIGEALSIVALSLVLHPLIAYICSVYFYDLSVEAVRSAVVTAAMAPGINAYIFATMYQRAIDIAANVVLIGTLLSVISISIWLLILGI